MLEWIKGANLLLRFLLELCALGALGYWGFKTGSVTSTKVVLGVGAPLVAAVVWGTFLSPSTTSLVSAWTEGLDPIGLDQPHHQIFQQPHQHPPMNRW